MRCGPGSVDLLLGSECVGGRMFCVFIIFSVDFHSKLFLLKIS